MGALESPPLPMTPIPQRPAQGQKLRKKKPETPDSLESKPRKAGGESWGGGAREGAGAGG